ncbi:PREDICTED: uncharacterized protein LOC108568644 [Nicrophorus vespilloides]|uniref:Uncharacterized protein LOC108568644 n=1 Tax=Nicrophorus vespilloides TaxID=110193 RepID=A0ABM1NEU1_NICVS|nr:PREDICTED: uncharacterized protein LOC108568644 [Nicrophorus vespilloides]XP_017785340.1 PREDICTED: uncharacterized protein LOC108568644 [Nicrophorus vespilloides]XP_017785341.1 PREDICTED: uncharacterized protein LOC108568644 [Nicrophorus vespilloides]
MCPTLNLSRYCIEVPIFMVFFAAYISDSINTNFVIYRTCTVILGYSESNCSKLGERYLDNATHELLEEVQPEANTILMSNSLLSSIIPSLICLFVGPWSDTHGRKSSVIVTTAGMAVAYSIKLAISLVPWTNPWFLLLSSIPMIFTGGFPTFLMICMCYATDTSTTESRGMRMAIFEVSMALGIFIGTITSSYIYHATSYTVVFLISTVSYMFAFIFTIAFVKETIVNISEIEDSPSLFSLHHIKHMIQTTIKVRDGYKKPMLLLCIASLCLYIFAINDGSLMYMYLIDKLQWSMESFTIFSSVHSIFFIVGSILGVYLLHKILKIAETSILLVSFVFMMVSQIIISFATDTWHIYLAAVMRTPGGMLSPMLRTLISKIVGTDEVGKIFSFAVALESFTTIVGTPLYTAIYNRTLQYFPGCFSLVEGGVFLIEVMIIIIIITLRRKQPGNVPYNEIIVSN